MPSFALVATVEADAVADVGFRLRTEPPFNLPAEGIAGHQVFLGFEHAAFVFWGDGSPVRSSSARPRGADSVSGEASSRRHPGVPVVPPLREGHPVRGRRAGHVPSLGGQQHQSVAGPAVGTALRTPSRVNLYWLPLGAGGHSVRYNGRVFEWAAARLAHRPACDLYHAALVVWLPEARYAIEQAPVPRGDPAARGVVATGPVGARWAGHLRIFRYEIRRWRNGVIPDIAEAVDSPRRLSDDPECARRVLELVASVPTPVWGRDELDAGEMWNSNSVMAWVITRAGLDVESIHPPPDGRAPGWHAGTTVARQANTLSFRRGPAATSKSPPRAPARG